MKTHMRKVVRKPFYPFLLKQFLINSRTSLICMVNETYHAKYIKCIYFISKGWIAKIKLSNMSELDDLMDEAAYDDFVRKSEDE